MRDETIAQTAKIAADGTSVGIVVGWAANVLPATATVLTIVWMAIRIIETTTVKGLMARLRLRFGRK